MWKKIIFGAIALVLVVATSGWYYVFEYSKTHHRNVENEDAVVVTATQIVKEYESNEKSANTKYLNKAIEVKGVVEKKEKDQAGNTTLTLKSGDQFSNIFCTLKSGAPAVKDSVVIVKGVCTGFLSDVVLNDAVIESPR
ncbi:MAG: OB-fold protein [Mucilaginibacter sp.]